MNKETKTRKPKEAKYITEGDKKKHFITVVDSSVNIINRQFRKISKCAKGRTFVYDMAQVEKLNAYLLEQVEKTRQRLLRTVEQENDFTVA